MESIAQNILVIEDEKDVVDLLALTLRKADGFNISNAERWRGRSQESTHGPSRLDHSRFDAAENVGPGGLQDF